MIRWWRTGWAPIQQALHEQRVRDLFRMRYDPIDRKFISALCVNGGVTVAEFVNGMNRLGDVLERHPEIMEPVDVELKRRRRRLPRSVARQD